MASDESLTLYRCGVCESMFQSATDCYAHVITHDAAKAVEIDLAQTDEIAQNVKLESDEHLAPALDVLAAASATIDYDATAIDITNVLAGESGIEIHIEEQDVATAADVAPTISYATLNQLKSQGDNIVISQTPSITVNTNEDLDIADILINIKQEKIDGDINIIRQAADDQQTIVSKTIITKPIVQRVHDISIPDIVRRRNKGEFANTVEFTDYHSCKTCGKKYAILKSLKHHEKTHNIDNLLFCGTCDKGFVKPSELRIHQKSHVGTGDQKSEGDAMFKCQYCSKEYLIEKSLKHHEKVHELGKRYMCGQCNKTFFKPSDMQRHLTIHKPLARCYVCKKSFRDKNKLEQHVRAHPELMMSMTGRKGANAKLVSLKACRYCGKACPTFSQLCNHIRTHTKKKPFPCDICGKTFNRVSNMNLHRRLHSGLKPFQCSKCDAKFADITNKNRHEKKYHEHADDGIPADYLPRISKIPVICDLPPPPKLKLRREDLVAEVMNAYRDLDKANKHLNVKTDGTEDDPVADVDLNVVECQELAGIPEAIQNLISGQVTGDGLNVKELSSVTNKGGEQVYVVFEDNPSVCYVVQYEGTTPSLKLVKKGDLNLSDENKDVSNVGLIDSEQCLGGMAQVEIEEVNEEDAEDCLPIVFPQEDVDPNSPSCLMNPDYVVLKSQRQRILSGLQKRFPCDSCGSKFAHRGSLKFHMRIHTKEGVMHCSICNAEFYRKSRLRIHMREHTGEKPYECSVCKKAFKVSYELTIHMREHTGRDTVPCDHCDKVFLTQRAYNAHMRDQSNIKPFSCRMCGKLFKRSDQRRRHMLTHFDGSELPFKCHKCDRSFGDSSNRKRHIIKSHGTEAIDSLPKMRVSLKKHFDTDH